MNTYPKASLGLFPTPMYRLPNMSRALGTNVWIKRDDLCGVALGGNKVRKLEYLLAEAPPHCRSSPVSRRMPSSRRQAPQHSRSGPCLTTCSIRSKTVILIWRHG